MLAEWVIWRDAFSPDECESILEKGKDLPEDMANMGVDGENPDRKYRTSKVKWMYQNIYEDVFDKMWKMTTKVNEEYFSFHIDTLRYMQLAEYEESYEGQYKRHHDVFWMNRTNKHRKLSVVLQLTDPDTYEGGKLNLEVQGEQPQNYAAQGTVIWFPSWTPHWVTPVTKGLRNSVVCWFEGPRWR